MATRKPRQPKAPKVIITPEIQSALLQNAPPAMTGILEAGIKNGLGNAIGWPGSNNGGFFGGGLYGPGQYGPGAPLSQAGYLFQNLRYYLVSNYRQMLSQAYVEIGLVQTLCDVPVDDALRGGVIIKSKELSEEDIEELQNELDRQDDLIIVGQAAKWDRLFGGAGIIAMTGQDAEQPLNIEDIDKDSPLEFVAVDQWELYGDIEEGDGLDTQLQSYEFDYFQYYNLRLHESYVMRIRGKTAPSFVRGRLRGWGFSVVETLVRSINQYLKAADLTFEVLDEFKVDVYKIQDLVNTMFLPGGDQKVRERIQMANWQKNYQNAIVMDKNDDWDHKQLSFAGLADAQAGIRMQVAADMRMPVTKLFGSQAGGLNPDDEADLEVYNGMVESEVRVKIKRSLTKVIELRCQQLFGYIPDDLKIEFHPLRMLKATDEETVKASKFNRLTTSLSQGAITMQEFRDACNKDNLFAVHLDKDESLELITTGKAEVVGEDAEGKPEVEQPEPEAKQTSAEITNADFKESDHPRDGDGQFGEGGGGGGKSKPTKAGKSESKLKDLYAKHIREIDGKFLVRAHGMTYAKASTRADAEAAVRKLSKIRD